MKKVEETLGSISRGTVFSKLDANSGFHQVVLTGGSCSGGFRMVYPQLLNISRKGWTKN